MTVIHTAGGMKLYINPGTGPVDQWGTEITEAHARTNIQQFMADLALPGGRARRYAREDDGNGRYGFRLYYGGQRCDVQMPGLPLAGVRWQQGLDPWQFPRLYIEGSSWLWGFALNAARRHLVPEPETED